jgi:hypothetical protein
MTSSPFTPSTEGAALRRRLAQAIEDAGLSSFIPISQIVITPQGFSLGTFGIDETSKITNILEDIAESANFYSSARRSSKSKQQSMKTPVRIPVDFRPAKVIKFAKESF